MANTPNIGLNLLTKGTSNWHTSQNDNFSKIDYELNRILKKEINPIKVWEKKLTNGGEPNYSTPLVFTLPSGIKTVITSTYDGYINCNNYETGEQIFRYNTNSPCYGRCAAINIDNQVYIFGSSHAGTITCLSETGQLRYIHKNIYDREASGTISSAGNWYFTDSTKNWVKDSFIRGTQGLNAKVSIISGTGVGQELEVSGVDENDHTKIWTYSNWQTIPDSTSVYSITPRYESDKYYQHAGTIFEENGVVYLVCCGFDGQIVKIRVTDGQIQFRYSTLESIEPYPLIVSVNNNLRIFCTSLDKYLYCLDTSGNLVFKTQLGEGADAFLNYSSDLGLLISCRDNRVYRINPSTGTILYKSTDTNSDIDNRPTVITDGSNKYVVVGNDDGYVYKLDETLDIVSRYHVGSGINSSIVVADVNYDGVEEVLVSDMNSCITILNSLDFTKVGEIYARGAIEGTPEIITNSDNKLELIIPSLDGYLKKIRFD